MTESQLIFSLAYQTPAIVLGVLLSVLIPSPPWRAIFVLPGVLIHELLHFCVAIVLNAQPVSFSLWPKRVGPNTWVMGSVAMGNIRWYNGAAVGLAPLIAPAAAIWFAPNGLTWKFGMGDLQYWTLAAPMFAMCLPSSTDLKIAFTSTVPVAVIAALAWWWLH